MPNTSNYPLLTKRCATGSYHLVDFYGLIDHITSSSLTQRRSTFRNDVSLRDAGCCVITQNYASLCDAAHIIPHCKGDEYISFVVSDRSVLYEDQQFPPENGIDINSTQNGVFLRKDLHAQFGDAMSAFLKTPNFALNPADVPRIEPGGMPTSRITLQHIIPPIGLFLIPQCDVRADWSSPLAPPSILLDYVYGVAAINRWGVNDIHQMMTERHVAAFSHIPPFHYSPPTSDDEEVIESNDAADPDYKPPGAGYRHRTHDRSKESGLSRAMDFAFEFSMYLKGYPPGTTLAMVRQKQEEEAELRSRQAGREVVQRWLQTGAGTSNTQE